MTSIKTIESIAKQREVNFLCHFTQMCNLKTIIEDGILSREQLRQKAYPVAFSDHFRLDDRDDVVSVSIQGVDDRMFADKRHKSGRSDWVVLIISSEVLWTHNCIFAWKNAATSEISQHRGWRGGPWAFDRIFQGSKDERHSLKTYEPTESSAEVQVERGISPYFILGAIVKDNNIALHVQNILGDNRDVCLNPEAWID